MNTPKTQSSQEYPTVELPGKVTVEPMVLETIARLTARNVEGVARIAQKTDVERFLGIGHKPVEVHIQEGQVSVDVHLLADPACSLLRLGRKVQAEVTDAIQRMVGMQVEAVNVYIEDVLHPESETAQEEA